MVPKYPSFTRSAVLKSPKSKRKKRSFKTVFCVWKLGMWGTNKWIDCKWTWFIGQVKKFSVTRRDSVAIYDYYHGIYLFFTFAISEVNWIWTGNVRRVFRICSRVKWISHFFRDLCLIWKIHSHNMCMYTGPAKIVDMFNCLGLANPKANLSLSLTHLQIHIVHLIDTVCEKKFTYLREAQSLLPFPSNLQVDKLKYISFQCKISSFVCKVSEIV